MQRLGFIHDMMDVKVLVLIATARSNYPMSTQEIYELCYQDDCLSYFDICTAIPEMVKTGHLETPSEDRYLITEKGREAETLTHDSLPFTVRERARVAVERYEYQMQRERLLRSEIRKLESGEYMVVMGLDDPQGCIMNLELLAPTLQHARKLEAAFRKNAEAVYQLIKCFVSFDEFSIVSFCELQMIKL